MSDAPAPPARPSSPPLAVLLTPEPLGRAPVLRGLGPTTAQPGAAQAPSACRLDLSPDDDTERAELPSSAPPWSPDDGADVASEDLTEEITDDDRADASADDDDTRARVAAYPAQARAEILADPVWQGADALVKLTMRLLRRVGGPLPASS